MAPSPFRSRLYRRLGQAVIFAGLALLIAQIGRAQTTRKPKVKGPRATALVELAANGKAHLIPITILVDGKFYDASAYKADPVPFALESQVIYLALRTGVPQGEFTVTAALQAQDTWFGEGKWVAEGSKPNKKHIADAKPNLDDDSGPPKLRRAEGSGSDSSTPPASSKNPPPTSTPPASSDKTPPGPDHASSDGASAPTAAPPAAPASQDSSESANDSDPSRPTLKRGKQPAPAPTTSSAPNRPSLATPSANSGSPNAPKAKDAGKLGAAIQLFPAVSDAGGPEPRPYNFEMKPDEEQAYRKKLFAIASAEVIAKAKQMTPVMPSAAPPPKRAPAKPAAKTPQPTFDNVQFRAFDLSNTNEPVFVMSADAHLPSSSASGANAEKNTYFITLVAKADIYLDLHKLLAQVTDDHHLDEFPRFELIDAVDADGDGRGELLFREVSDAGTAWAVYRAAADQLYPLFEGKPQQPHPMPVSAR
jgi:hypothetical protein